MLTVAPSQFNKFIPANAFSQAGRAAQKGLDENRWMPLFGGHASAGSLRQSAAKGNTFTVTV